jgi:hypothetical protein
MSELPPNTAESETPLNERLADVGNAMNAWARNIDNINSQGTESDGNNRGKVVERMNAINSKELTDEQKRVVEEIDYKGQRTTIQWETDQIREQAKLFLPKEGQEK